MNRKLLKNTGFHRKGLFGHDFDNSIGLIFKQLFRFHETVPAGVYPPPRIGVRDKLRRRTGNDRPEKRTRKDGLFLSILLILPVLLATSCEKKTTLSLRDPATGNLVNRQILISGNDTLLHGPSLVLGTSGDTLEYKWYERDELLQKRTYRPEQGVTTSHNYRTQVTVKLKKKEGLPFYEKKTKGDSLISWRYWDREGKEYPFDAWHIMHSGHYYSEYLKYLNTFRKIPRKFRYRVLFVPARGRPGMIDLTPEKTVWLYLFDYSEDRYEYKHVIEKSSRKWVKYNTRLTVEEINPSEELLSEITAFIRGRERFPDIRVDWQAAELNSFFFLVHDGATASTCMPTRTVRLRMWSGSGN
jgi:hypothetical protein